jgi:methylated-DNA-protein-cysteine methyltransferase related protein
MVREASGRWTEEDEREAARWLGREDAEPRERVPLPTDRREAVLQRIRETPRGFVRTYGDVSPGAPRFAGTVLHGTHDPDLPWFRIVRADGSLTQGMRQRKLLEAEGVPFRGDKVDMRAARVP